MVGVGVIKGHSLQPKHMQTIDVAFGPTNTQDRGVQSGMAVDWANNQTSGLSVLFREYHCMIVAGYTSYGEAGQNHVHSSN